MSATITIITLLLILATLQAINIRVLERRMERAEMLARIG